MSQFDPPPHQPEMDAREDALKQDGYLLGIALVCLVNGMHFSPWYELFLVPVAALATGFWISSQLVILYLASFIISVSTVILAGVPAALYERRLGSGRSTTRSLQIWLLSAFVIAIPALMRMFGGA